MKSIFEKVDDIIIKISSAILFIMMIWVFSDAVGRYVFNHPLPGTLEITEEYLMVCLVFLSISYAQKHKAHVRVDLFIHYIPERMLKITDIIMQLFMLFYAMLLTKQALAQALWCIEVNSTSRGSLGYPLAPAYFLMGLGLLMTSVRILFELVEGIKRIKGGQS
ncbi:MAG: TRAP-type transport system small permease protein [Clostridiales bacterium]|jgi:TRAP-type C4-dicarboxylate transport system permease small subunit|nr:TRAP-type transport system small permease protein [Clostridiales bacterium]MDN5298518.1 TRAP-type transport system small permease protein [Clostridiales bacterium]